MAKLKNHLKWCLNDLNRLKKVTPDCEMARKHLEKSEYNAKVMKQLEESKNILEFCDLEWQDKCLDFHKTKRAVRTSSIVQVTKKMYKGSSDKWKSYKKYLQPLISRIDKHNHN